MYYLKRDNNFSNRSMPIRRGMQYAIRRPILNNQSSIKNNFPPKKDPFHGDSPIPRFSNEKNKKPVNKKLFISIIIFLFFILLILLILFLVKGDKTLSTSVSGEDIEMQIKNVQIQEDSLKIDIEVDPKKTDLVEIKFIVETDYSFEIFRENVSLDTFSEKEFILNLKSINSSEIIQISVFPIFEDKEKKRITGSVKDTYSPKKDSYSENYNYSEEDYFENYEDDYLNYSTEENNYNYSNNYTSNNQINNSINNTQTNYTNITEINNSGNNTQINYTNLTDNPPLCGNGILEIKEYCDSNNLAGETCESLGYASGILGCRKTCEFDTRYCVAKTPINNTPISNTTTNPPIDCVSYSYSACYNNDVYWYNSCGVRGIIREDCTSSETCTNGECVITTYSCSGSNTRTCSITNGVGTQSATCNTANGQWVWGTCSVTSCNTGYQINGNTCIASCSSNSYSQCYNGDVYWYNSCGVRGSVRYDCTSSQTCSNGACVNNPSLKELPLKISLNSRYLIYQDGTPFLMTGDTAWSLIAQVNKADADYYLQSRKDKGFNVVLINLLEAKFADNAPANYYGNSPFTGKYFTTPNEAYFSHADYIINSAKEKGIVVLLAPIYLGWECGNEGFCSEVKSASENDMISWGRYIGNRYKDYDNIIWDIGGDVDPTLHSQVSIKTQRVAEGIKEYNPNALFTAHNARGQMAIDTWSGASWLNVNDVYTADSALGQNSKKAYEVSPVKPFFLFEAYYENDNHGLTQQQLRSQKYITILSGGFGNLFGNCPLWGFGTSTASSFCSSTNWKAQLNSDGTNGQIYAKELFESRDWYLLIPDFNHLFFKSGYGTLGQADYAIGAKTSDSSTIIIYLPTQRTITVDTTVLSGSSVRSWWYNPSTGVASDLGTSTESSSKSYSPPSSGDWILVIDDSSKGYGAPGQ